MIHWQTRRGTSCGLFVSSSPSGVFQTSLPKVLVKGGGDPVHVGSVPLFWPKCAAFSFVPFPSVFPAKIICCSFMLICRLFMRQFAGQHDSSLAYVNRP